MNAMVDLSPTRYARSDDVSIAYRVAGEGPVDLVYAPGWVSNVEYAGEGSLGAFLAQLADFSRVIVFDKRGTGLSDRVEGFPTLEHRMDDLRAVLDAVGSPRATLLGASEGGSMCLLFAAAHPERVERLITYAAFAKRLWSEDYPWAPTMEERQKWIRAIVDNWDGDMDLKTFAPSLLEDPQAKDRFLTMMRSSASPGMARRLAELNSHIDIRAILPAIRVPTLVLHRDGDMDVNFEEGKWIASQIPGARFVGLHGTDHLPGLGDVQSIISQIRSFITGSNSPSFRDRLLTTLLFTDIVDSTGWVTRLGDERWKQILAQQESIARAEIEAHRGNLIKFTGDGLVARFYGPSRAIRCAWKVQTAMRALGVEVRAGAHTGEVELTGDDVSGLAVHVAARIMGVAGTGQIATSRVVRDLCVGAGLQFEPVGEVDLKGIEGKVEIHLAHLT